jgi:Fe-S-cluster-containing dehydrogenase component/CRP-like cAMP-binding protein
MPHEITDHDKVLGAITKTDIFSELGEEHEGNSKHELDLEVLVYGRHYAGKQVGPYARLWVYDPGDVIIKEGNPGRNKFYVLLSGKLDVFIRGKSDKEEKGIEPSAPIFGAMSLLSGQLSNATVKVSAEGKADVLEIGRPALRLLRKFEKFATEFDSNYRKHGLWRTLVDVETATHTSFSPQLRAELEEAGQFRVHAKDHLLFKEGDPIENLIFIRRGWVQRVRSLDFKSPLQAGVASNPKLAYRLMEVKQNVGLDFLGAGNWLGLEEVKERRSNWNYTATVMSRAEVLELELDLSHLRSHPELVKMIKKEFPKFSNADDTPPERPVDIKTVAVAAREINTGIVDGANLLVMDMNLCIRCGNCSLACHKVHGQSRLLRRGIDIIRPVKPNGRRLQHVLLPSVCLHCHDAECLSGCPTGAIERFPEGQINIHKETCIGCGDCATQCPYDAISMVSRKPPATPPGLLGLLRNGPSALGHLQREGSLPPKFLTNFKSWLKNWHGLAEPAGPSAVTETENLLAVKCNLCQDTPLNPKGAKVPAYSCQENCPTGALVRVNPREYFSEAGNAIGIVFRDATHAVGRNIHQHDTPAKMFHAIGALSIGAIVSAVIWAAQRYTLDGRLDGTWLTMRWITGLIGLGGIAAAITYMFRKQIYRRRAGPLRYWRLAHVYLGLIAGMVLLLHGGRDSGGLLTSLLMVTFNLTIVSGLFGIGCHVIVPRIMTKIEGNPLLVEDLRVRREELRKQLGLIDTSDPQLRDLIKVKMRKRFFSFRYLLRQYLKPEELTKMLALAREEFQEDAKALADAARDSLMEAVDATATLRRVDSLIYLHQLLRLWLAPHVVSTSIMLALMLVHIVQVSLFTVK